jgi:hypothetical protein
MESMTKSKVLKACLIASGAYYTYVGLKGQILALVTLQGEFWTHFSVTNSVLDLAITALGLGLIYSVSRRSKRQMFFIISTAMLSWLGFIVGVLVFFALFARDHTLFDTIRYSFDLVCCAMALVAASIVWWKPALLHGVGQLSNAEDIH